MINNILEVQPTKENPYIVDNYPYGAKKCMCRFWIESVKNKGDRWVKQTQNPKSMIWNKPKKSTYQAVMVAYINKDGHITYKGIWRSTEAEEYKKFIEFIGSEDILNDLQKTELKYIRAVIKAYSGVTYKCVSINTKEEREKHNEKQKKTQQIINNRVKHEFINDEGDLNEC